MQLDRFDSAAFLRDTWQKRPLLIRRAWRDWHNPIAPDDLAGLACEDEVESRLIVQARDTLKVEPGPIPENRFGKLGKKPWTLLVQAVDHHVPAVAALWASFGFVPNWRSDDVMVSYATDGGGVGPHFDQYDVFLIQGLGRRRWQVGSRCDAETELRPHDDLRLLADFQATDEWVLEPGDMLYVPPRFAHNGVAVGDDCMTYSIGFRAPSRSELIAHFCDHVLAELSDDDRYADPDLSVPGNRGEITADALATLHAMVTETLSDTKVFSAWFGAYTTMPQDGDCPNEDVVPEAAVEQSLRAGAMLHRNPASRFSYIAAGPDPAAGPITLFVDGRAIACAGETAEFARTLCAQDRVGIAPGMRQSAELAALVATLLALGSVFDGAGDRPPSA